MNFRDLQVFPILAKPTEISCAVSRLMPGISFAMIYASLLTKTNRIARILAGSKKRFPTRKPLFMSATAQVSLEQINFRISDDDRMIKLVIGRDHLRPYLNRGRSSDGDAFDRSPDTPARISSSPQVSLDLRYFATCGSLTFSFRRGSHTPVHPLRGEDEKRT